MTGIAFSASGLGIVLAPQISTILFNYFSWRETLTILGGVSAQICVLGMLMSSMHEDKLKADKSISSRPECCNRTTILGCLRPCCSCFSIDRSTFPHGSGPQSPHDGEVEENDDLLQKNHSSTNNIDERIGVANDSEINYTMSQSNHIDRPSISHNNDQGDKSVKLAAELADSSCSNAHRHGSSNPEHSTDIDQRDQKGKIDLIQNDSDNHISSPQQIHINNIPTIEIHKQFLSDDNMKQNKPQFTLSPIPRIHDLRHSYASPVRTLSDQELSKIHSSSSRVAHRYFASSNPSLNHRRASHLSNTESVGNNRPFNSIVLHQNHLGQEMVISGKASIIGLIPSTSHLDIVIKSNGHHPAERTSALNSSIFLSSNSNPNVLSSHVTPSKAVAGSRDGFDVTVSLDDVNPDTNFDPEVTCAKQTTPLNRNISFWILCVSLFLSNAGCGIYNIHFPGFLKDRGMTDRQVTDMLSLNGLSLLIGRCLCAALANSSRGNDLIIFWSLHVLGKNKSLKLLCTFFP